jgi:alpha-mannosidase
MLLVSSMLLAQNQLPEEARAELKKLPTHTQAVIPQLFALDWLEQPQWKMHTANLPHGETVDLDDSAWEAVKTPSQAPADALWYRAWIEVPKNVSGDGITGARIFFHFNANADGLGPTIVYFNGRRVAMGDDLEPIVLFDEAKPGDKVLVAVKLTRSLEPKHFEGADLRIVRKSGEPNSETLWQEIFSTAEFAPALGPDLADTNRRIEAASAGVDVDALHRGDQQAFDRSIVKAHGRLEQMSESVKKLSVQLTGNSHIDAAWLWPWTETVDVVRRTFGTALQLMDEYPQLHYAQSAAQYSEWMEQKYPPLFQRTVDRANEKRWEFVGGMWVEPDLNMPDGESLVRQLLIGKRYFRQKYGAEVHIGWNPDSFGYNWQLPQIYKKSGIDYFVTQKMSWNETNKLPLTLFWWQSPDGSRVLTYFPSNYGGSIEPVVIANDLGQANSHNPGLTEVMHLFGEGDHGGGPTRDMLDRGIRWSSNPALVFPTMNFGSAQDFFSAVESKLDSQRSPVWNYKSMAVEKPVLPAAPDGKIELPVWNDELYLEFHRGVFTTQAKHKQNMRESEEWLLNAEKYSALAWLRGDSYPGTNITEAWKKVLFNQFHDLAAGSGIGVIYKDAQQDYDVVHWTANDATSSALRTLSAEINTKSSAGVPVIVWNSLAWPRTDLVMFDVQVPEMAPGGVTVLDPQGQPLLAQTLSSKQTNIYRLLVKANDVPAIGYKVLHVIPGTHAPQTDLTAKGTTLENSFLKVTVDPSSGCISSLYDKEAKFETIAAGACGNELLAFRDTPKEYDAWNVDADFEKDVTRLDQAESVKLSEQGPLRATIRVTRNWQNSKFVQEISLYAQLKSVEVTNDIDWHETHVLLKAAFPLAASAPEATFEIPYGTITRPTTRNNSWEAARFEVPALRWADLGDGQHGFSLLNESKYGYDSKGNTLRLSLLRSPKSPDPEADQGHHHFSYFLYPHSGDWKQSLTIRRGYEFNYKLEAYQAEAHGGRMGADHSYVNVASDNVVLTAVKKTEDGDGLLLRLFEWAGKSGDTEITVPEGAVSAQMTNLMEAAYGNEIQIKDSRLKIPVHPFEIVSVRVNYASPAR